ncbi:MAG: hypothetical protein J5940_02690, partial [Clostridia bacterium]|nr:hypothetical protein [Clostridia bacterium]
MNRRNTIIYIICFTLTAAMAVTFVTAAGTAALAGHCGRIAADDPFDVVKTILEKRAAESESEQETLPGEMPALADADESDGEARLAMLT